MRYQRKIFQLKVSLLHFKPSIYRRLLVPNDFALGDLHHAIQIAMGWDDAHLHTFIVKTGPRLGAAEMKAALMRKQFLSLAQLNGERHIGMGEEDEHEYDVALFEVMKKPKDKMLYWYDFGDDWKHEILLEKVLDDDAKLTKPKCVAGKRAGPPEDCGGPFGYARLLHNAASPAPDKELLEWLPENFDPEAFSVEKVNRILDRSFEA